MKAAVDDVLWIMVVVVTELKVQKNLATTAIKE